MPIRIVRLGAPREPDEGIRLGTVRRPPRGVRKQDIARRDFYDAWLPELAPSDALLSWVRVEEMDDVRWRRFAQRYRKEMAAPAARHLLATLAALSHASSFAVGCYCADASRCHRTLLRELLAEAGATIAD